MTYLASFLFVLGVLVFIHELGHFLMCRWNGVRVITFSLGSGLASPAGALITPLSSVDPNMGVPWLVSAFMLVLVSGMSLLSLGIACAVLGGAQVLVSTYGNPILGGLTIVVLAAVILRLRPQGFARE